MILILIWFIFFLWYEEENDVNIPKITLVKYTCDLSNDQCSGRIFTAKDWAHSQSNSLLSTFSETEDINE